MDKYQNVLLKNELCFALLPYKFDEAIISHCSYDYKSKEKINDLSNAPIGSLGKFWKFIDGVNYLHVNNEDTIIITQAYGQKYCCLVPLLYNVDRIKVIFDKGEKDLPMEVSIFNGVCVCTIDFDFANPVKKIIAFFKHDMANPLEIQCTTILFVEPEIDYKKLYLIEMNVSHSTGLDLVNIYFQPCCEEYDYTEIALYSRSRLMAKYKIEPEVFFKSINGLAFGQYEYTVTQYNSQGDVLIQTDKIKFNINRPNNGNDPITYV